MQASSRLAAPAALVFAAFSGAALAIGGTAFVFGIGRGSTTVVREGVPPQPTATPTSFSHSAGLSINQIYSAAAPGVVQVSTTKTVAAPAAPFGALGLPQTQT